MSRAKTTAKSHPDLRPLVGAALQQAGLLAGLFLAPIVWGRFDNLGGALVLACLCLSGIGFLLTPEKRLLPARLPLTSTHLALAGLLLFSALSYFVTVSRHATLTDLMRLLAGVLVFGLVLWSGIKRGVAQPAPQPTHAKPRVAREPAPRPQSEGGPALRALFFALLVGVSCSLYDWNFYYASGGPGLALLVMLVLGFLAIALLLWRRPETLGPLQVVLISSGIVAAYGLCDWLYMRLVVHNTTWQIFATFFNPNSLAGFLGMALFLALAATVASFTTPASRARRGYLLPLVVALLCLAALLPTYSKGAWASIYLAGVVFLICLSVVYAPRAKRALAIGLIIGLLLVAPVGLVAARPSLRAKATEAFGVQNRSNMFRYLTWKATANMARAHPLLGVGAGAFEYSFGKYAIGGYTRRAHQNYLETAAEVGLPGFLCLVWLFGAGLLACSRTIKRATDPAHKTLAGGALAALLVMALHSFIDYDWYISASSLLFCFALAVGISAGQTEALPAPQARKPLWQVAGAVLLLLVAGKALLLGMADKEFRAQQDALSKGRTMGNVWQASQSLQAAIKYAPEFGQAYAQLAVLSSSADERLAMAQRAVALEPTYSPNWINLGRRYQEADRLQEAQQAYGQATRFNPQHLNAWLALARLDLQLGQPQQAVAAFSRLIEIQDGPAGRYQAIDYEVKTEYGEAHYNLAAALQLGILPGGPTQALQHLEQAVRVADAYLKTGRELDIQRSSLGQSDVGKASAEALALKARSLARWAQLARAAGRQNDFTLLMQQAELTDLSATQAVASEDSLWHKQ